jgi:menaquinol-cytochrome c reductase iron-sulfur subunit
MTSGIESMPDQSPNRRSFVSWLTTALVALIGALLASPAVAYFTSPLWKKRAADKGESEFSDAGSIADLAAGVWRLVTVEVVRKDGWETTRSRRSIWVRRPGDGGQDVVVLSPICPHLGCSIILLADQELFQCPCHGGTFNADKAKGPLGQLLGGPPPRNMDPLQSKIEGGRLWVLWQDFKIGTPDRISVD